MFSVSGSDSSAPCLLRLQLAVMLLTLSSLPFPSPPSTTQTSSEIETLSKEDSLLRSICNGGTEVNIDSEGWVVLDRCGRHFGLVLNFLRDGSVPLPEEHRELDEVLKEAQYYRVQGLVQHCLSAMQKQKDVFETVCRIPMITSAKEEQKMIATCRKPVVKLQNNRGNNKYSYTSNSDDNLLKNIELFDKLVLRFNGRVLFVKDVLGDEICCWSFYGEGRKIAEVCCTSIVYATEKKQTKVEFPEARIFEETLNILIYENGRGSGPGGLHLLDSRGSGSSLGAGGSEEEGAVGGDRRFFYSEGAWRSDVTSGYVRGTVAAKKKRPQIKMMLSEKEAKSIRKFVCGELRDEPDLSTLTLRILKKRYLARVQCDSLSPEAKHYMKQVIGEELVKSSRMQDSDKSGSEVETKKPQNKRKRERDNDEVTSGEEDESTAKKSRCQSGSSSESEDKEDCKTGSEESEEDEKIKSEDEEQEVEKSQPKKNGGRKPQTNSENSTDEEKSESEKSESDCGDSPKKVSKKKASTTKNEETGKKTPQSDEENDTDTDNKSEKGDKITANGSSDNSEKEDKVSVEKKNSGSDSDSSSLPSLDDEKDSETEKTEKTRDDEKKKKKKTVKKEESAKDQKNDDKAVTRLKRYISLCGVRRNYKKLLEGCRSVRSQVAALKKELEDLGVHGQPSIEKCKKVRKKREEAQEIAELDVSNIIATQGRPKRRASAWQEQHDPPPPSSPYLRTLDSGSDSDADAQRGRRRATDWSNLQGIISDDADSD
ncbi:BTB/POZ domain-containing adapter for CUL3-mediated [Larimichthys crocea]|uniref:BTB/POZ domain-containing adapter for CUL3-mediated n=1 Tax=Larimichthys crocea TaxID=215358 RepID=A0A6G0HVR4_LARCR|nr:BTB/POZ domain-containing adapter for CUL3-mediated [Larimichthys crocea]